MADLTQLVSVLASSRTAAAMMNATVAASRAEWEATNTLLLQMAASAEAALTRADAALRDAALAAFTETGDVAPVPGVKIVQRTVLDYTEETALAWAKSSGLALKLDTKAFEKVAKATPIPGVTTRQVPSVTVATDLTTALQEPTDAAQ